MNCNNVFNLLVKNLSDYCKNNVIKSLVLGISGGIDSTVVSIIAKKVCDDLRIPLIGRSLPIKNSNSEFSTSKLVGDVFCSDFKVNNLYNLYKDTLDYFSKNEGNGTSISQGNIQARLRMTYLYNIASINKGIVLSTDNQTEYQLGFWTIHGDVGDYDPIQSLWKTEVYELANYLLNLFDIHRNPFANDAGGAMWNESAYQALKSSISLTPTDGLGISNSDLDQIGAKSYEDVEDILKTLMVKYPYGKYAGFKDDYKKLSDKYGNRVVEGVWIRHLASSFKREKSPVSVSRQDLDLL